MKPETIYIRYLGKGPKKVELPIPFTQKCEKTGEVVCDPIGEFPFADGMRLLEMCGSDGPFVLVDDKSMAEMDLGKKAETAPEQHAPQYCQCGCGGTIAWKKHHKTFPPKFLMGHYRRLMMKKNKGKAPSPLSTQTQ